MSPVKLWCLLICIWLSGTRCQGGDQCPSIWEIGERYPLYCSAHNVTESITLQVKINNEFVNVSSCNANKECTDYMAPTYRVTGFGPGVDLVGGIEINYVMEVYVNGIKKNENVFRCSIDGYPTDEGCLEEYVRPSTPVCDPPTLVDSDTKLSISCFSEKVYPGANIGIRVMQNNKIYPTTHYEVESENKISPSLKNPGYNVENSTVRIPLSSLEPNNYEFVVWMYPDISNDTLASDRRSESAVISSVVFADPKVRLSSDCPIDSYITSGTCKCELSTPGYPPGQAKWYTQSGQVVGTENTQDRSSTINISYDSEGSPARYECRAWTVLNVSSLNAVLFTPNWPDGPNFVTIRSSAVNSTLNLCASEEPITIVVTCETLDDVQPGVTWTISVNDEIVVDQQDGEKTDWYYSYDYHFKPSKGGRFIVFCKAQNILISSQSETSRNLIITVQEPPSSAPVLTIPGNVTESRLVNVIPGQQLDVTCKVSGGYPEVSAVTIVCGPKSKHDQGTIAALSLTVTEYMDGQICYCTAQHSSNCYNKMAQVKLELQASDSATSSEIKDQTTESIIGLSATVAAVIVVLIIVLMCWYRNKTRITPDVPRDQSRENHHLSTVMEPNQYITPICPDYVEYATIVDRHELDEGAPAEQVPTDYLTVIDHYDQANCFDTQAIELEDGNPDGDLKVAEDCNADDNNFEITAV